MARVKVVLVDGSWMTQLPSVPPAFMVRTAPVVEVTVCAVMEQAVPETVKVGVPGVPGVHVTFVPVRVTKFPVVDLMSCRSSTEAYKGACLKERDVVRAIPIIQINGRLTGVEESVAERAGIACE